MSDLVGTYGPKGRILWDCWFIKEKDEYHVFYLQCLPVARSEDRHDNNVSIGHAVSKDLIHWKELPDALVPGVDDDWDSLSLWTGSVIKKDDTYYMFYTGRSFANKTSYIQKIGVATSKDMIVWEKHLNNPILEVDDTLFDSIFTRDNKGIIGSWRDPFVWWDENQKRFCMTISAFKKDSDKGRIACVALATSENLLNWNIQESIFTSCNFDEIEVTKMIYQDKKYYLFFSGHILFEDKKSTRGLYCYYSDSVDGEYVPVNGNGLVYDYEEKMCDMELVHIKDNEYNGIASLYFDKGYFVGKLSKPVKFKIYKDKVDLIN